MPEPQGSTTEYHDEYSETLGTEFRQLEDALLSDSVSLSASAEPLRLDENTLVEDAVEALLRQDRVAVMAVDHEGRLTGVATDRDLLGRACHPAQGPGGTRLMDVMTRDPETVRPDDRMCYALNRMVALGCRAVPVVDEQRRPLGIMTVEDIARWLAALFPEAILNLRPGDRLRRPAEPDGG